MATAAAWSTRPLSCFPRRARCADAQAPVADRQRPTRRHHQRTEPQPGRERIDVQPKDGFFVAAFRQIVTERDIEIDEPVGVDRRLGRGLRPLRIIAAGISNGAGMAVTMACTHPRTYAVAFSVAGWVPLACIGAHVSLVAIGGTGDHIMGHHRAAGMVKSWLSHAVKCSGSPTTTTDMPTVITTWTSCSGDTFVRLIELDGVDHFWPDFNFFDASRELIRVATHGS